MKKSSIFALAAFLFITLNLGCADGGGKNRRARINPVNTKSQNADLPESGKKTGEDETQAPAPVDTAGEEKFDEQASNEILKRFETLRLDGEVSDFSQLKDSTLTLEAVTVLFKSTQSTIDGKNFTSLYRAAVEMDKDGGYTFAPQESDTIGQSVNPDLLALPMFVQVFLDKDLLEQNAKYVTLKPVIKNNTLTLEVGQLADAESIGDKALEDIRDLLELRTEEAEVRDGLVESPKTKAQVFAEVRKTESTVEMLIEARVSERETQTFLLSYKIEKALAN